MSKYNYYARKLDESFVSAREQYLDALAAIRAAETELDSAKSRKEYRCGDRERWVAEASYRLTVAKADLASVKMTVWPGVLSEANRLRGNLADEVARDMVADGSAIDHGSLGLLKSGILTPADYIAMAEKFASNPTMRRLIGAYASGAAEKAEDREDKLAYMRVCHDCKGEQDAILERFDVLTETARVCSGQRHCGGDEYISAMANHWEELTHDSVDNF